MGFSDQNMGHIWENTAKYGYRNRECNQRVGNRLGWQTEHVNRVMETVQTGHPTEISQLDLEYGSTWLNWYGMVWQTRPWGPLWRFL